MIFCLKRLSINGLCPNFNFVISTAGKSRSPGEVSFMEDEWSVDAEEETERTLFILKFIMIPAIVSSNPSTF